MSAIDDLQTRIGHRFGQVGLLVQALTHRSFGTPHYERLEFIGDALLDFVIAENLFQCFEQAREGDLSRMRAALVREQTLHELALELDLGAAIRLGEGELRSGGAHRASILADTLEAVLGAVYLDAGLPTAQAVIGRLFAARLAVIRPDQDNKDAKTRLQEFLQARRLGLPVYNVLAVHGAAHAQSFDVQCAVPPLELRMVGSGPSRRLAEQAAASEVLRTLES
jgi:ribonuclease-3